MVFKTLPRNQVSDDLLWAITGNNNCFLRKNQGVTFSLDPCNLSGLNLKRDSGISSQEGIGIQIDIAERKAKKKPAKVVRFNLNLRTRRQLGKGKLVALKQNPTSNNSTFSTQKRLTVRSIVKVLRRGLKTYRPDLHALAFKKVRSLHKFAKTRKNLIKKDAKKAAK